MLIPLAIRSNTNAINAYNMYIQLLYQKCERTVTQGSRQFWAHNPPAAVMGMVDP